MRRRRERVRSRVPEHLRVFRAGEWPDLEAWQAARAAYWQSHPEAFKHSLELFAGWANESARAAGRPVPLPEYDR